MASGSTLPPQAYTREILTAAFNWLQTQTDLVRKSATTPDALVALFMRAQRFNETNPESDAPVSSQNFMSDLKNLAEGLKQFESSPKEALNRDHHGDPRQELRRERDPRRAPPVSTLSSRGHGIQVTNQNLSNHSQNYETHIPPHPTQTAQMNQSVQHQATYQPVYAGATSTQLGLNERSLGMIHEVKAQLNLSCEAEAINMMVSLAYKSLKNLLT